jgi:hypothetical protein
VAPGWETTLSKAQRLLITADGGGSNGWRLRLWKVQLQKFADESGLFAATAVDHIAAHAAPSNWASACREC